MTGVRTDHGDVECEVVVNCAGQWAKALGDLAGVTVPAALRRALLRRHRAGRGHPSRPADHARPRRLDLLQGGGRRAGGRRLRARRQAVARARPTCRTRSSSSCSTRTGSTSRSLMEQAVAPHPGARARPGSGSSTTAPSRFTPDNQFLLGRGARAARLLRRRRVQLGRASPRPAAPGARWPSGSSTGEPTSDLVAVDVRRFAPFHGDEAWLRSRVAEILGLHYAVPWPDREPETGRDAAPVAAARPAGATGRRVRHPDGLGAAATSSADRRTPSARRTPGDGPTGCPGASPSSARRRSGVAVFDQTSFSQVRRRRPRRARPACSGSAPPTSTSRSGAASTRRSSTRAAPTRPTSPSPAPDRTRSCWSRSSATTVRDLDWIDRHLRPEPTSRRGRAPTTSR